MKILKRSTEHEIVVIMTDKEREEVMKHWRENTPIVLPKVSKQKMRIKSYTYFIGTDDKTVFNELTLVEWYDK